MHPNIIIIMGLGRSKLPRTGEINIRNPHRNWRTKIPSAAISSRYRRCKTPAEPAASAPLFPSATSLAPDFSGSPAAHMALLSHPLGDCYVVQLPSLPAVQLHFFRCAEEPEEWLVPAEDIPLAMRPSIPATRGRLYATPDQIRLLASYGTQAHENTCLVRARYVPGLSGLDPARLGTPLVARPDALTPELPALPTDATTVVRRPSQSSVQRQAHQVRIICPHSDFFVLCLLQYYIRPRTS